MTQEQAFKKWWRRYCIAPADGYAASVKEDHMQQAFLAGIKHQEIHQLGILADIRKAVGDPTGRLMQSELLERVKQLVSNQKDNG